jgi:hypothetical protein
MIWMLGIVLTVAGICECIADCVERKYKWKEFNSCCSTCPMKEECEKVSGNDRQNQTITGTE